MVFHGSNLSEHDCCVCGVLQVFANVQPGHPPAGIQRDGVRSDVDVHVFRHPFIAAEGAEEPAFAQVHVGAAGEAQTHPRVQSAGAVRPLARCAVVGEGLGAVDVHVQEVQGNCGLGHELEAWAGFEAQLRAQVEHVKSLVHVQSDPAWGGG